VFMRLLARLLWRQEAPSETTRRTNTPGAQRL